MSSFIDRPTPTTAFDELSHYLAVLNMYIRAFGAKLNIFWQNDIYDNFPV